MGRKGTEWKIETENPFCGCKLRWKRKRTGGQWVAVHKLLCKRHGTHKAIILDERRKEINV